MIAFSLAPLPRTITRDNDVTVTWYREPTETQKVVIVDNFDDATRLPAGVGLELTGTRGQTEGTVVISRVITEFVLDLVQIDENGVVITTILPGTQTPIIVPRNGASPFVTATSDASPTIVTSPLDVPPRTAPSSTNILDTSPIGTATTSIPLPGATSPFTLPRRSSLNRTSSSESKDPRNSTSPTVLPNTSFTTSSSSSQTELPYSGRSQNIGAIAGSIVGAIAFLLLIGGGLFFLCRRGQRMLIKSSAKHETVTPFTQRDVHKSFTKIGSTEDSSCRKRQHTAARSGGDNDDISREHTSVSYPPPEQAILAPPLNGIAELVWVLYQQMWNPDRSEPPPSYEDEENRH
ncbi:hypothetical protein VNI00_015201 [Paramarasmius palmivorus]|uniref:Uncharacterized protein n=1 Tax=Paramarasmius palmivorus TaxID=297713 RepID=A0AAW0BM78_9AGAR